MLDKISEKFPLYIVGGKCRDDLLGIEANDIDYCCVASQEEFELYFNLERVGNSFPVYLNTDGSEIALTREETKIGNTYQSFECVSGVSIESDLFRRDISVNSIARCYVTGKYIDPTSGIEDIKNKIIRCVNPDAFMDDAVRILRICRMKAKHPDFTIEQNTFQMMKDNVQNLKNITPERILLELQKTYEQAKRPSDFFRILDSIGGLGVHFQEFVDAKDCITGTPIFHPEIYNSEHLFNSFDSAKKYGYSFSVAISALLHDLGKNLTPKELQPKHHQHECKLEILDKFFFRHKFTSETMKLSKVVFRNHMAIHNLVIMRDFKKIKMVRKIPRHMRKEFIEACHCDAALTAEQVIIFDKVCQAIDTAKIEIPKTILKQGKEVIDNFVNQIILQQLRRIDYEQFL